MEIKKIEYMSFMSMSDLNKFIENADFPVKVISINREGSWIHLFFQRK